MPGVGTTLTAIWARLLDIDHIGDSDFFALGGHPALLMLVGAEIREAFGVELSQRQLFDATTIASQSVLVACALVQRVRDLDPATAESLLAE
ncbi:MAG TPA: phosphopantetheine-binding protein [Kofleriaceae bacterium]|jgi:hypothetical protein